MSVSSPRSEHPTALPLPAKVGLAVRVWLSFARVHIGLRSEPLPALVSRLASPRRTVRAHPPERLSRAVDRSLRIGTVRPRCLTSALVLFRLLHEQGDAAELVIGLPPEAVTHEAHAWVELGGIDVGPPPGQSGHAAMARFGA